MSNDKDIKKEVEIKSVSLDDVDNVSADTTAETNTTEVDDKITKLETQLSELNDKYLRLAAELENTRRRAALDAESRARNRAMSVAEKILPVMDAIEVAKKHSPDDEGIKSMARAMESAFAQIGITKIEAIGEKLNPMFHNAIQVIECPDKDHNIIVDEMQSGYMFGDSVLRNAMVIVSK